LKFFLRGVGGGLRGGCFGVVGGWCDVFGVVGGWCDVFGVVGGWCDVFGIRGGLNAGGGVFSL